MISKMAMGDIEQMLDEGLQPSPADIVRLNAIGLRVEYSQHEPDLSVMPRVAFCGDVAFHEPTVGAEIWISEALRHFDERDFETVLLVRAFALYNSRNLERLPDSANAAQVQSAIEIFKRDVLKDLTVREITAGVLYAVHGASIDAHESPPAKDGDGEGEKEEKEVCFELGLLRRGVILKIGTWEELKTYTPSALDAMITIRLIELYKDQEISRRHTQASGDYWRTLEEIRKRLAREKLNNG
jgi:hypothetical protein